MAVRAPSVFSFHSKLSTFRITISICLGETFTNNTVIRIIFSSVIVGQWLTCPTTILCREIRKFIIIGEKPPYFFNKWIFFVCFCFIIVYYLMFHNQIKICRHVLCTTLVSRIVVHVCLFFLANFVPLFALFWTVCLLIFLNVHTVCLFLLYHSTRFILYRGILSPCMHFFRLYVY